MLVIPAAFTIWTMSNIKTFLHNNFIQGDEATYLIGDSGYPLLPYLLTPIRGAEPNTPESLYTQTHQQIRNCIERTNGLLKGVWQCLHPDRVTLSSNFCCTDFLCLYNIPQYNENTKYTR